jgi:peroxiredoxin
MASLQDQLDQITASTRSLVPAERLAVGERAIEELFASGIEEKILPVGSTAPAFALEDITGRIVRSSDLLALGPLVLKFFRGRWCPYCVTELEVWRDLYPRLREHGALVAGVSPQTSRQNDFMAGQHHLPYPLLADHGCALASLFGLVYSVPAALRDYYLTMFVNLPFINGDEGWRLPIPATYVLSPQGRVLYAQAYADYRVRPEPEEVIEVLSAIAK